MAVIDISQVFKNHNGFKQAMESMQEEVKTFEDKLRGRAKEMEQLQVEMKAFNPSSPEYRGKEEQLLEDPGGRSCGSRIEEAAVPSEGRR